MSGGSKRALFLCTILLQRPLPESPSWATIAPNGQPGKPMSAYFAHAVTIHVCRVPDLFLLLLARGVVQHGTKVFEESFV